MNKLEQAPVVLSDISDKELDEKNQELFLKDKQLSDELAIATPPTEKQEKAYDALERLENGGGVADFIYGPSDIFQLRVPASMVDSVHKAILKKKLRGSTILPERDRARNTQSARDLNSKYGDQLSSIAEREMKASQE